MLRGALQADLLMVLPLGVVEVLCGLPRGGRNRGCAVDEVVAARGSMPMTRLPLKSGPRCSSYRSRSGRAGVRLERTSSTLTLYPSVLILRITKGMQHNGKCQLRSGILSRTRGHNATQSHSPSSLNTAWNACTHTYTHTHARIDTHALYNHTRINTHTYTAYSLQYN